MTKSNKGGEGLGKRVKKVLPAFLPNETPKEKFDRLIKEGSKPRPVK